MDPVTRRQLIILIVAVVLAIGSFGLLVKVFDAPGKRGQGPGMLEMTASESSFQNALKCDWSIECGSPGGVPRLRHNLMVDSFGLVPAYVILLILFTCRFAPSRQSLQWLSWLPALAAGSCDWLENGLLARAVDDLVTGHLTATTLAHVAYASRAKWLTLALALAVLAYLVATRATENRVAYVIAALALGSAAIAFAIGGTFVWQQASGIGMVLFGPALLALACLTGVDAWRGYRLRAS